MENASVQELIEEELYSKPDPVSIHEKIRIHAVDEDIRKHHREDRGDGGDEDEEAREGHG